VPCGLCLVCQGFRGVYLGKPLLGPAWRWQGPRSSRLWSTPGLVSLPFPLLPSTPSAAPSPPYLPPPQHPPIHTPSLAPPLQHLPLTRPCPPPFTHTPLPPSFTCCAVPCFPGVEEPVLLTNPQLLGMRGRDADPLRLRAAAPHQVDRTLPQLRGNLPGPYAPRPHPPQLPQDPSLECLGVLRRATSASRDLPGSVPPPKSAPGACLVLPGRA